VSVVLTVGGVDLTTGVANTPRPDVTAAYSNLTGNHGFVYDLPASMRDGKPHALRAYAIDGTNARVELSSSPKTFTLAPAIRR